LFRLGTKASFSFHLLLVIDHNFEQWCSSLATEQFGENNSFFPVAL
jgi:hypothetical protein